MNNKISKETQDQALKIAKGTQKKGQTKEQTKLIAQGVEKGIAEYKKQQSQKAREKDKQHKQKVKNQNKIQADSIEPSDSDESDINSDVSSNKRMLPWLLLTMSWLGFIIYLTLV
jgi:hypothetical protein